MSFESENLYPHLLQAKARGEKKLAVLIDPGKLSEEQLEYLIGIAERSGVHYVFIGGSLLMNDRLDETLNFIRGRCDKPLVLFPGNGLHISKKADGLLFLSLISSRNPELLIGQQVSAAPLLRAAGLEVISCGYMLVDGGKPTTVQYMSNSLPIPSDKTDIAMATALAGEMLGLKTVYLEAGSGANYPVPAEMIKAVAGTISLPLIVGGGIRTAEQARSAWNAGADLLVVGNAIENNPDLIPSLMAAIPE